MVRLVLYLGSRAVFGFSLLYFCLTGIAHVFMPERINPFAAYHDIMPGRILSAERLKMCDSTLNIIHWGEFMYCYITLRNDPFIRVIYLTFDWESQQIVSSAFFPRKNAVLVGDILGWYFRRCVARHQIPYRYMVCENNGQLVWFRAERFALDRHITYIQFQYSNPTK